MSATKPLVLIGSLVLLGGLLWPLAIRTPSRDTGSRTLLVYCAAGMAEPMQEIAREYENVHGVRIQMELDASGKLLSKIQLTPDRGHLFLAADEWYLLKGREQSLIDSIYPIAEMFPALVVSKGNKKNISSLQDLLRDDVRIMLAHPSAAIGRTSQWLLESQGLWESLQDQPRVSFTGTVNEVASAVQLGTVDVGIIYDSLAQQFGLQIIPVEAFERIPQRISIGLLSGVESEADQRAAIRFAQYLQDANGGLRVFARHHFTPIMAGRSDEETNNAAAGSETEMQP